jgi:hypothetical protein
MRGRDIVRGIVGCPECQKEYAIDGGIVRFGVPPTMTAGETPSDAGTVQALLGISSPGGYVVLVGSAVNLVGGLTRLMEGVHLVGVNPPRDVQTSDDLSLLEGSSTIPLRSSMARGVVLGSEYGTAPWAGEAVRVLLPGLRMLIFRDDVKITGIERVVAERGLWLGKKG